LAGDTYARFRLSTQGGLGPNGAAADGEVEDYRIKILPADDPLAGDLTGNGSIDFQDLTILLANWNRDVSAAMGNLVSPDTTRVDRADLNLLLDHWTGRPAAGGQAARRGVGDSSSATSAVFDQIGEESSSEDVSQPSHAGPQRASLATTRRGNLRRGRLQATVVDQVMTGPLQEFTLVESRFVHRRCPS
jgi:hypothetical protein